jgi:two-component system, sensor histidine kinase and response regulator
MDVGRLDDVLDRSVLAQLYALDEPDQPSLLTEMIAAFLSSAPGHLHQLRAALAAGDAPAFAAAAHALKGTAVTLGGTDLQTAAGELEVRGIDCNLSSARQQLSSLEAEYAVAVEALHQEEVRHAQAVGGQPPQASGK